MCEVHLWVSPPNRRRATGEGMCSVVVVEEASRSCFNQLASRFPSVNLPADAGAPTERPIVAQL